MRSSQLYAHAMIASRMAWAGSALRDQRSVDLMDQLALHLQDVYLFDGTLWANVGVGTLLATDAEVDEAHSG